MYQTNEGSFHFDPVVSLLQIKPYFALLCFPFVPTGIFCNFLGSIDASTMQSRIRKCGPRNGAIRSWQFPLANQCATATARSLLVLPLSCAAATLGSTLACSQGDRV